MKVKVRLNCTSENPYHRFGLSANPFPAYGRMEHTRLNAALAILAARPMPTVEQLRKTLIELESTQEFADLCIRLYMPGQMVEFIVDMPP